MLKALLYADLERQLQLSGQTGGSKLPCSVLLRRLPHPRFLPIVLCRSSRSAFLNGFRP